MRSQTHSHQFEAVILNLNRNEKEKYKRNKIGINVLKDKKSAHNLLLCCRPKHFTSNNNNLFSLSFAIQKHK